MPVAVIDGFIDNVDELVALAGRTTFAPGGAAYPGIRASLPPTVLADRRDLVIDVLDDVFGFDGRIGPPAIAFSLVTCPEAELAPRQRIPHYDRADIRLVAGMLYLLGPQAGGTAFYRHRRTGFERISRERKAEFEAALEAENAELGPPTPRYYYGDTERFELIGEVGSKPGRLTLYPGRLLHSGVIPSPRQLSADPAQGRLTINMFFQGE